MLIIKFSAPLNLTPNFNILNPKQGKNNNYFKIKTSKNFNLSNIDEL